MLKTSFTLDLTRDLQAKYIRNDLREAQHPQGVFVRRDLEETASEPIFENIGPFLFHALSSLLLGFLDVVPFRPCVLYTYSSL